MIENIKIAIEVTRRCNLKCKHCCRGDAENKNISFDYIDSLLSQVKSFSQLTFTGGEPSLNTPAIKYFLTRCMEMDIKIDYFSINTNGIKATQDFIDVCNELYFYSHSGNVTISNDKYHRIQKSFDRSLIEEIPFATSKREFRYGMIMGEGRGRKLNWDYTAKTHPITNETNFYICYLYLNVNGDIINGIDWSYENQKKHFLCNVQDITDFHEFLSQEYCGYGYEGERNMVKKFNKQLITA